MLTKVCESLPPALYSKASLALCSGLTAAFFLHAYQGFVCFDRNMFCQLIERPVVLLDQIMPSWLCGTVFTGITAFTAFARSKMHPNED